MSIGTAEILAARETIDVEKSLMKVYETLFNVPIKLVFAVNSKDLYPTLTLPAPIY